MIDAQEEMRMANGLKKYFPMIRTREEILDEISGNEILLEMYRKWDEKQRREFLDFCTGVKGVKILYDSFFKEIMDPDAAPERLEEFLSLILKQQVKILNVLPNDSTRIAEGRKCKCRGTEAGIYVSRTESGLLFLGSSAQAV